MKSAGPGRSWWAAAAVFAFAFGSWFAASRRASPRDGLPPPDAAPQGEHGSTDSVAPGDGARRLAPAGGAELGAHVRVRIVAANLSSGADQSWDLGPGKRLLQALKPDVVLIQEFNVGRGSRADAQRFVEEACGSGFSFFRESNAQIPNGVISRWPIRAAGTWEDRSSPNREFVWARIDAPGPVDLWAVSLHLLTRSASLRERQGRDLVALVRERVPEDDYLVIGGDLNTKHGGEPVLRVLDQLVSREHVPVGSDGRAGTNSKRKHPYDQVLPDRDLQAHHIPVELSGRRFPHGLVFDTRTFGDLPPPARPGDSGAAQMQHMAVVQDFLLPTGG